MTVTCDLRSAWTAQGARRRSLSATVGGVYAAGNWVRAASQRRVVEQRRAALRAVARSQSMAASLSMARIDEDATCELGAAAGDGPGALCPRSQSCVGDAAGRRALARRGHGKLVASVV
ncbi:hypothetical protein Zm00014a_035121 [Zea mays]|uniref:Uncharacterized protein n=1 Tax=Zea mays TaxID=4577 RepID=A0A3L6EKV6_MAIZE|nr:hypothetical protein Zm00014a_035121 [Zea mays]